MNVFIPVDEDNAPVILVDFASTGIGLGMSDVAMHIHHANRPEHLEGGGEELLVRGYWEALVNAIESRTKAANNVYYPWTMAQQHYRFAVVDYARFCIARLWRSLTPESMMKQRDNMNVNLICRSPSAAMAFIKRVDNYLGSIEHAMD